MQSSVEKIRKTRSREVVVVHRDKSTRRERKAQRELKRSIPESHV